MTLQALIGLFLISSAAFAQSVPKCDDVVNPLTRGALITTSHKNPVLQGLLGYLVEFQNYYRKNKKEVPDNFNLSFHSWDTSESNRQKTVGNFTRETHWKVNDKFYLKYLDFEWGFESPVKPKEDRQLPYAATKRAALRIEGQIENKGKWKIIEEEIPLEFVGYEYHTNSRGFATKRTSVFARDIVVNGHPVRFEVRATQENAILEDIHATKIPIWSWQRITHVEFSFSSPKSQDNLVTLKDEFAPPPTAAKDTISSRYEFDLFNSQNYTIE